MSCSAELEGVVSTIGSRLRDCTMALYNGCERFRGNDVEVLCSEAGAKVARVLTVSSVSRSIGGLVISIIAVLCYADAHTGSVLVGTSEELVLTWWGPGSIPQGHLLLEKVDTITCQPEQEDTLLTAQCTGWMKLLMSQSPQFVADVYSESGECFVYYL